MRDDKLIKKLHKAIDLEFQANSWKGTWKGYTNEQVRGLLFKELNELFTSVEIKDFDNAILEAADIALFSVFLADPDRVIPKLSLVQNEVHNEND